MRSRAETALTILFLVNVLNFYDRLVLGAVLEPMRREFALSDTQLGAMVTLFTMVYAIAGLPAGRLSDTRERRGLLAMGIAIWAGLTGMAALATSYAMVLATRLGVGIGEAVCTPAATSWIGDAVDAKKKVARHGLVHDGGAGGRATELFDRRSGSPEIWVANCDGDRGCTGATPDSGGAVAARAFARQAAD